MTGKPDEMDLVFARNFPPAPVDLPRVDRLIDTLLRRLPAQQTARAMLPWPRLAALATAAAVLGLLAGANYDMATPLQTISSILGTPSFLAMGL
jgi:hypothetical protein